MGIRNLRILSGALLVFALGALLAKPLTAQQASPSAPSQEELTWEKKMNEKADELIKKNGPGTNKTLAAELIRMGERDQDIRKRLMTNQSVTSLPRAQRQALVVELNQTDMELTAELKKIVAANGWPTIALVGSQASQAAFLVLGHSEDHQWQKQLMPQLEELVQQEKIFGDNIPIVEDKILKSEGKPQRFGTQFDFSNGVMVMWPVEDPDHLEELREKYMQPPMAVYRKQLADMYHMPVK